MRNFATPVWRLPIVLMLSLGGLAFADQDPPTLEVDLNTPVNLEFQESTVGEILEAIAKVGRLSFVFDEKTDLDARTSVSLSDVSFGDALDYFLRVNRMFYVVRGPGTALIAPDTRQKRQEHTPQGVRTFSLRHADGRTVIATLRSQLQTRNIVLDERLNAVTIKDTFPQLQLAAEIIRRVDRSRDEVTGIDAAEEAPLWGGSGYELNLRSVGRPIPQLEVDMERPVTLGAREGSARQLYERLSEATGIQFLFDRDLDLDRVVSFSLSETTAGKALDAVNETLSNFSVVWGPKTVFIAPDERGKRHAHEHNGIRFFYLSHADPKSVITSLRTILQIRQIAEIPRLNAVVVRDNVATLKASADLIAGMDVPGTANNH